MNLRTVACECSIILPGIQSDNCDIWNYHRICMKCPLCTYQAPTTTTTTITQEIMHLVKRSAIKGQFKLLGKDWIKGIKFNVLVLLFNDFTKYKYIYTLSALTINLHIVYP